VAHGVNPAVKEVETPNPAAILDRARTEAERYELRRGHHSMLPRGESGPRGVRWRLRTAERGATGIPSHLNAQFVTNNGPVAPNPSYGADR
jgi:hypothetical protein